MPHNLRSRWDSGCAARPSPAGDLGYSIRGAAGMASSFRSSPEGSRAELTCTCGHASSTCLLRFESLPEVHSAAFGFLSILFPGDSSLTGILSHLLSSGPDRLSVCLSSFLPPLDGFSTLEKPNLHASLAHSDPRKPLCLILPLSSSSHRFYTSVFQRGLFTTDLVSMLLSYRIRPPTCQL